MKKSIYPTIHGLSKTSEWVAYREMKRRCLNEKSSYYDLYGGRGIRICSRWLGKDGLVNLVTDMGNKPRGTSLDRIDNNGSYSPENCRWGTPLQQTNNRESNHYLTFNGETLSLSDMARKHGVNHKTLSTRLCRGWSLEKALKNADV